jgi:hypothetical protein
MSGCIARAGEALSAITLTFNTVGLVAMFDSAVNFMDDGENNNKALNPGVGRMA